MERQEFAELVERYRTVVCAVAYAAVGDAALAEELAQETFLIAWRKLPLLSSPPRLPAWLCGIARHLARNERRRRRAEPLEGRAEPPCRAPSPLEDALAKERDELLRQALDRVPPRYREPLVLFYFAEQSVAAVAEAFGVSEAAARQRLSRGRRRLREHVVLVEAELSRCRPGPGFAAAVVAALASTARAAPRAAVPPLFAVPAMALIAAIPAGLAPPAPRVVAAAVAPAVAAPAASPAPPAPAPPAPAPQPDPEPPRPAAVRTPSRSFVRALAFHRKGDHESASILFHAIASGEAAASRDERRHAELLLAVSVQRMGLPAAALGPIDMILGAGRAHPHFLGLLPLLASIARGLPDPSPVVARLAAFTGDDLDDPALAGRRGELLLLMGRQRFQAGELAEAAALLASVDPASPAWPRARFLEAVTEVRRGRLDDAVRVLQGLVRDPRLGDLAHLTLGRTLYGARRYRDALVHFDQVSRASPLWLEALLDSAWAHFRAGDPATGLGNLHTLNAPYFDEWVFPEALELAAIMSFDRCHFDRAEEAIGAYQAAFVPAGRELVALVAREPVDDAAFSRLARARAGRTPPRLDWQDGPAVVAALERPPDPRRVARRLIAGVLADESIARAFAAVDHLQEESARLGRRSPSWRTTAIAGELAQELAVQTSLAEAEAGDAARRRLAAAAAALADHHKNLLRIRIEILQARAVARARAMARRPLRPRPAGTVDIGATDEQQLFWPWRGEYWRDELGHYRVDLPNRCPVYR